MNFLYEPFFRRNLEHHFGQLETRSVILLFLRTVGTMQRSFLFHHRREDGQADDAHEDHAADNGAHDEDQLSSHSKCGQRLVLVSRYLKRLKFLISE